MGWSTSQKLKDLGIGTVRQLRGHSKEMLQRQLGPKTGQVSDMFLATGLLDSCAKELAVTVVVCTSDLLSSWYTQRVRVLSVCVAVRFRAVLPLACRHLRDTCPHQPPFIVSQTLWMHAHGVDQRVVEPCTNRRSVGAECNYGVRCEDMQDAENLLRDLAAQVSARLRAAGTGDTAGDA